MFEPKRIGERDESQLKKTIQLQEDIIKMCQDDPELTDKMVKMAELFVTYQKNICYFADTDTLNLDLPFEKLNYPAVLKYFKTDPFEYLNGAYQMTERSSDYLKSRLKARKCTDLSIYSSEIELTDHFYKLFEKKALFVIKGEKSLLPPFYHLETLVPKKWKALRHDYIIYLLAQESKLINMHFLDFLKVINTENNRFHKIIANAYYNAFRKFRKDKKIAMVNKTQFKERLGDLDSYPTWIHRRYEVYYYKK